MMWETGQAATALAESKVCNFNQSECYQAKSLPVVFNLSHNKGYTTGGQNITVQGYGFDSGTIHASFDGVQCEVTSFTRHEFNCQVKPKAAASDMSHTYVGQYGVTRHFINKTSSYLDFDNIEDEAYVKMLALDLSAERNFGDKLGSVYKTWFVPPKTTRYRFYMICDDYCLLKMGECPNSFSPLSTMVNHRGHSAQNSFFSNEVRRNPATKKVSDWIELTEGEKYYMQAHYAEYGGGDHMKTAVEIEQTEIVGHH